MSETNNSSVYSDPIHLAHGDHSITQLIPTVFEGIVFLHWSRNVKLALSSKNKLGFLTGKCAKPNDTDPKLQDWIRTDYTVLRWILHSLSESISSSLTYVTSSKELWEELNERYNQSNAPMLYQLRKDMLHITQGDESVWEDLRSLDGIPNCDCGAVTKCSCYLLKKIVDRDNTHMLIDFLMGLDKKYESLRGRILAMDPLLTVNQAFSKVH
ncbi:hypothetical protein RND81_06G240600 [Saponaria officinalis]|uniref:Retrotransposon Copia-like N-terminal domain-containing protein n=1 Tax=Saponaria officinalis TaxID=3572 RepID=A0AAW1KES3_SAPOF